MTTKIRGEAEAERVELDRPETSVTGKVRTDARRIYARHLEYALRQHRGALVVPADEEAAILTHPDVVVGLDEARGVLDAWKMSL
jgi:hypothetical protein